MLADPGNAIIGGFNAQHVSSRGDNFSDQITCRRIQALADVESRPLSAPCRRQVSRTPGQFLVMSWIPFVSF